MDKKEIKSDLILDKIINSANYIIDNKNKFSAYFGLLFGILIFIVFIANKTQRDEISNNAYSSASQNNFIDDNKELAMIGFNNILKDNNKSESYNQALIYVLSDAIDNNNNTLIDSLLKNNKFQTKDDYLNYQYVMLKANYYANTGSYSLAVDFYEKSMKYVKNNPDYLSKSILSLVDIYINESKINKANELINTISKKDLSYAFVNRYERYKYKIDYLTK